MEPSLDESLWLGGGGRRHQGGGEIIVTMTTGPPLGLSEQLVPAQLQGVH